MRREASKAVKRGGTSRRPRRSSAKKAAGALEIDQNRLRQRLGADRATRTVQKLGEAADSYADGRYEDARRLLKSLADALPDEPAVRELYGLTLYRLGRWRHAIRELEAFADRSGSTEQHPVLADCHRALGHHDRVAALWDELGEASPDGSIVAEGRIVMAGSMADRGDLTGAITFLEKGSLGSGKLRDHHLRLRYVLGDLYDRAGDHQAAKRLFGSVAEVDAGFADVAERLAALH